MNRKKEDRAERLYSAIGRISPSFVEEAENYTAAAEASKTAGKTSRQRLPAPAWLRPVAACLAVLILGGLVVFSIPVVNNIISRRGPAELPGTDVAEADTTAEETEAPEETEVSIGDVLRRPTHNTWPAVSINLLIEKGFDNDLIREEVVEQIKLGMTFNDLKEMGVRISPYSSEAQFFINNGKILILKRKNKVDFFKLHEDQLTMIEGPNGLISFSYENWTPEIEQEWQKFRMESPIEEITVYEDPELWEVGISSCISRAFLTVCENDPYFWIVSKDADNNEYIAPRKITEDDYDRLMEGIMKGRDALIGQNAEIQKKLEDMLNTPLEKTP